MKFSFQGYFDLGKTIYDRFSKKPTQIQDGSTKKANNLEFLEFLLFPTHLQECECE